MFKLEVILMVRKIIKIEADKCNGCGACASACHEGAIQMIDGVAVLTREDYCDGFGDCLPACPTNAISFEEREAPAYDEQAVADAKLYQMLIGTPAVNRHVAPPLDGLEGGHHHGGGCPSSKPLAFKPKSKAKNISEVEAHVGGCPGSASRSVEHVAPPTQAPSSYAAPVSQLSSWPVQIKLAPVSAPYFDNANLLIAADCTAFAYANFHNDFIKDHICLIGCPKLDEGDYTEKLTAIISQNNIKSLKIVRMQVPCCGGIQNAAQSALKASGKFIPWQCITVSIDGNIL